MPTRPFDLSDWGLGFKARMRKHVGKLTGATSFSLKISVCNRDA